MGKQPDNDGRTSYLRTFGERIKDHFHSHVGHTKVALAIPNKHGRFEIPVHIGISRDRRNNIQDGAAWSGKHKKSFFTEGLLEVAESKCCIADNTSKYYTPHDDHKPGYLESEFHLIVPIKLPKALAGERLSNVKNCLGVLTISTSDETVFEKGREEHYYDEIAPFVRLMEAVLLQYYASNSLN